MIKKILIGLLIIISYLNLNAQDKGRSSSSSARIYPQQKKNTTSLAKNNKAVVPTQAQIRYQQTIKGGVTMIGNSWFYSNPTANDTMLTADIDGDNSTAMSSSADLILPAGSKIEKVFLSIESGYYSYDKFTDLKLKVPGATNYSTLSSATSLVNNSYFDGAYEGYAQMIWDITALVPTNAYVSTSGGGVAGRFYLADPNPLPYNMGGWSIIVVYSNPNSKFRSITVADNWQYFYDSAVETNVSGIKVPSSGNVTAVVGVTGTYGDRGYDDFVKFGKQGDILTSLKDPMTGSDTDVLNSSIAWTSQNNVSADGGPAISSNYNARNPISAGHIYGPAESWDFDADIFDASGILTASFNPTDITFRQESTGGDILASGSYFISVDLALAPKLLKTLSPTSIYDGGTATYTWTVTNTLSDAIVQTISFTDNLPASIKVASVPNASIIGGTGGSIIAPPGSGTVAISNLQLNPGQSATIKVDITNVAGQLNASCTGVPSAFTNSSSNITIGTDVSLDTSGIVPQCLIVKANKPFICNTKFYLSQYPLAGTTTLYELDNTTNPFTITSIGASPAGMKVNGIGYNTVDNLIYGIRTDTGFTNYMVRIDANGVFTSLGAVTNLPIGGYNSGAFDNGGNYYVLNSGSTRFYRIDVTTNTATLITLSRSLNVNDIVYDKTTGKFFGYEGVSGANILVSIDPATGTVANIGASGLPNGTLVGALYVDASGDIFGNADNGTGFYQFNKTTGRAVKISNSIGANGNDGTNCPNAVVTFPADLSITKTDNKTIYTPGTTNTYTIVVSNSSGQYGVLDATVSDPVPAGIPAANVSYSVPVLTGGATTSITGTQTGALNDVVGLPVGATITYTVTINVPVSYTGNLTNTATVIPPVNSSDPTPGNNTATDTDTVMWPTCTFDNTNGGNTTPVPVAKSNISVNAAPTITYLQNASASASRTNEFDFGGVNLTNSTGNTIPNVLIDISKLGFWTQNVSGTTFKLYAYNQANQSWEGTLGNGQTAYFKIVGVSVNGAQITNPNIRLLPVQNSASVTGYHFASTGNTVSDAATSFTDGGTGSNYSITGATVSLPQNLPVIDLGALTNGSTLTNVKIRMGLVMPNNADAWVASSDSGVGDIDYYVYGFADVWGTGYDFGDAPSSYGIAQHAPAICSPAIYIGPNRQDYESSVTGNTTADADDLNMPNYDDENDSLPDFSAGQTSYSVTLPYVNNAASGTVSAWIDWNNNGIFDASERATATIGTGNANATLIWRISGATTGEGTIPAIVTPGYKVVRTRVGSISSEILNPFGIATDGEVEDRLLFVTGYCTKPGDFSQGCTPTKVGITNQTKLSGWPESVPNGHIVLESKDKGLVITRVPHVSTTPDLINDSVKDPKEGMIVYDIQDKCVKLYNGSTWKCIKRSCNDYPEGSTSKN